MLELRVYVTFNLSLSPDVSCEHFLLEVLCHSSRSFRFWSIHYSLCPKYIYSYVSVGEHLGCFHALTILSNATNEDLYTRFVRHLCISWVYTYSELLGCILNIISYLCRNCQTSFQSNHTITLHPHQQCLKIMDPPHSFFLLLLLL